MRIALDAMGGDFAPEPNIEGCLTALQADPELEVFLVGDQSVLDDLIEYHYKRTGRPFRFCHVGDLLGQARDFCEFHRKPLVLTRDMIELAVLNYFSGMETTLSPSDPN